MSVFNGRYSATIDGDFVVFIIGMRVNRPWRVKAWWPVFTAMPKMIRELEADPSSGFLGATQGLMTTGPTLIQYWRSFDDLERYARDSQSQHLPAWRAFNQAVRDNGDVGIWHETYSIHANEYENVYVNMMPFGLGKVGELVEAGGHASGKTKTALANGEASVSGA